MENKIIKANSIYFNIVFSFIIIVLLIFLLPLKIWITYIGNTTYIFILVPVLFFLKVYKQKKASTIILKNGFIMLDSQKEILEITDFSSIYEKTEYKREKFYEDKQVKFYLCFEKKNVEVFKLDLVNYNVEDREYIYKYINYYGSNVEKLDSTTLNLI